MLIRLSIFMVLAIAAACNSQAFAQEKLNTAKLDSLFSALETNNRAMGAMTIRKNGQVLYSRTFGYYKLHGDEKLKPTDETKYRIGSISKMFTAVMILQLVEEKKLELTTLLSEFFPSVPNAKKITIADLLTHHSGLHNFTNDSTYLTWMTKPHTEEQMLDLMAKQQPDFTPGQKGDYSNTNYVLLGYIVERAAKARYGDELKRRIVDKIGLKNTYYGARINTQKNEAVSYEYVDGKWEEQPETDMSIPHGAGAIVSTTGDLTQFIEALFNHQLLRDESLATMTTIRDNYGMGIFQVPFYEKKSFGHTGGIDGFVSSVEYFPSDSLAIAFTSNGLNYAMDDILVGVLSIYFDKPYTIPSFKIITLAPETLSRYEGVYGSAQLPIKITIANEKDHLTAQATGQSAFPLEATSDTEFKFDEAGVVIDFKTIDAGKFKQLLIKQGGRELLFTRE